MKHLHDSKDFIEYLNDMDYIYKKIEEYNPNEKRQIIFDDMIAAMVSNKKLDPKVVELFIRGRKLKISFFYHRILFLII